jgi:hypothetical protein
MEDIDVLRARLNRLAQLAQLEFGAGSRLDDVGQWLIDIGWLNLQIASRALDASARMKEAEK